MVDPDFPDATPPDQPTAWREAHLRRLLDSHVRLTGRPLLDIDPHQPLAPQFWRAPQVIVSHGTEADPILNYGNRLALERWQMPWPTFVHTPSRFTAEPVAREARAALLARVSRDGFIDGSQGVRIAANGQRFRILQAVIWNVVDAEGVDYGQAASFCRWEDLPPTGG